MPEEIERKFLIASIGWQARVSDRHRLRDGTIARFGGGKVRVRVAEDRAWLTIKGPRSGISRAEFEYPIPPHEAEEMLRTLCTEDVIEKTRHRVPVGGLLWSVDVYHGPLQGLTLAEVELEHEGQLIEPPPWIGREVTGDVRYRSGNLLRSRCVELLMV